MSSRRGVVIIVFMFISRFKWALDQDRGEAWIGARTVGCLRGYGGGCGE